MEMSLSVLALQLPRDAILRLDAARGVMVCVRSGRLWLTEQGLPDDVFLGPGQSWRLRSAGRTVVQADQASTFELADARRRWRVGSRRAGRTGAQALRESLGRLRTDGGWMPVPPPSALAP